MTLWCTAQDCETVILLLLLNNAFFPVLLKICWYWNYIVICSKLRKWQKSQDVWLAMFNLIKSHRRITILMKEAHFESKSEYIQTFKSEHSVVKSVFTTSWSKRILFFFLISKCCKAKLIAILPTAIHYG